MNRIGQSGMVEHHTKLKFPCKLMEKDCCKPADRSQTVVLGRDRDPCVVFEHLRPSCDEVFIRAWRLERPFSISERVSHVIKFVLTSRHQLAFGKHLRTAATRAGPL